MTQEPSWPAALTRNVGSQVRRLREEAHLSAQALADALTSFGLPYTRAQVTNLEAHARAHEAGSSARVRRGTVTLGEVIAFAAVLGAPPLQLIFPVGREQQTEVHPARFVDTWDAAKWFSGEAPMPRHDCAAHTEDELDKWSLGSYPLIMRRELDSAVQRWSATLLDVERATREASAASDPQQRELLINMLRFRKEDLQRIEREIMINRNDMRDAGLDPGPLDARLTHLERVEQEESE